MKETYQNSRRERIIARNRARRRRQLQNHIVIVSVTVCLILLFSLFLGSFLSEAKEKSSSSQVKCFKSVMLMYGETLEDMAEEQCDECFYATVDDYISEILSINSLENTACVTPGQYVVIPYYTAAN